MTEELDPIRRGSLIDAYWQSTYAALIALVRESDVVLLPRGGWPDIPCGLRFYDLSIEIGDATILVLHKGRLSAIRREALSDIDRYWQCTYANPVFVMFCASHRAVDIRSPSMPDDYIPVREHLHPSAKRTRKRRIFFTHVPKTGGTSVWNALKAAFPSNIYFPSDELFQASASVLNDYDLIGGHIAPGSILKHLAEGDRIVGLIRSPERRLISNILYWKGPSEDVETYSPEAREMREMALVDLLHSRYARWLTHMQLMLFGTDGSKAIDDFSNEEMMENALRFVRRNDVLMGLSEQIETFLSYISRELSFTPGPLLRLNVSDRSIESTSVVEIERSMKVIRSKTRVERMFYKRARRILVSRQAALGPLRRLERYLATRLRPPAFASSR